VLEGGILHCSNRGRSVLCHSDFNGGKRKAATRAAPIQEKIPMTNPPACVVGCGGSVGKWKCARTVRVSDNPAAQSETKSSLISPSTACSQIAPIVQNDKQPSTTRILSAW
jgi:hypothetical protein